MFNFTLCIYFVAKFILKVDKRSLKINLGLIKLKDFSTFESILHFNDKKFHLHRTAIDQKLKVFICR